MDKKIERALLRFLRAFIASAAGSMVAISPIGVNNWGDVNGWLSSLALSGLIGGVSGVILALDKYLRD